MIHGLLKEDPRHAQPPPRMARTKPGGLPTLLAFIFLRHSLLSLHNENLWEKSKGSSTCFSLNQCHSPGGAGCPYANPTLSPLCLLARSFRKRRDRRCDLLLKAPKLHQCLRNQTTSPSCACIRQVLPRAGSGERPQQQQELFSRTRATAVTQTPCRVLQGAMGTLLGLTYITGELTVNSFYCCEEASGHAYTNSGAAAAAATQ